MRAEYTVVIGRTRTDITSAAFVPFGLPYAGQVTRPVARADAVGSHAFGLRPKTKTHQARLNGSAFNESPHELIRNMKLFDSTI